MPKQKKRHEFKLNLGTDINGIPVRKSFYSIKSLADARKKAEDFKLKYEMELCVSGSSRAKSVKFEAWAKSCLEMYKKPYVKANTYNGTYLAPAEQHLIPYIRKMNISDIRPIHIQRYINEAAKKYAPETVKKDFNVLWLVFDTAVDNQICAKSPATKSIKLPKYETRVQKQAYTQEQYNIAYRFASEWKNGLSLGDGVCEYGTGFALTLGSGFNIFLGSGYALADGRWLKNDERHSMTLPVAGNSSDRYDAIAVQVNYETRSAGLELLSGIDLESVRENPAIIRNEKTYSILLYLFHIRRGATTIRESDVTDLRDDESLCGRVTPVEGIAAKALEIYAFLTAALTRKWPGFSVSLTQLSKRARRRWRNWM